jgi:hypothetical protein
VAQGGLGGQQAHGLPDKQRVALGCLVDGGHLRLRGHHTGDRFDEALHCSAIQTPEIEQLPLAHQLPQSIAHAQPMTRVHVAVGPHHQQPGAAKVPRQELQQQQGRVIGRVEVVQDQQQRLHRRHTLEETRNRLE